MYQLRGRILLNFLIDKFSLFELRRWLLAGEHGWDKLQWLPRRELLRHDGTLGRHGSLCRWVIFGCLGIRMHELPSGPISSDCRIGKLYWLPHGHFP